MQRLVYILLVLMAAGVVACHRQSETEARLIAIDSLIGTAPDSALALLEEISPSEAEGAGGSMAGEEASSQKLRYAAGDRAYHALLTAQAMWKAYIPATSDSLINIAWDYYKDHGPYDRRIRAMLYKGTTAEELGHPEDAMRWYKRTELEAKGKDIFYHGYALFNMAYLYQTQYIASNKAISLYRQAYDDFRRVKDLHYQMVCMSQLGLIYRLENVDSSIYFANNAIKLSKVLSDTIEYYRNIESLAGLYYAVNDWNKTLYYALITINGSRNTNIFSSYCFASQSYAKLEKKDSAIYLLNLAPDPKTRPDSVLYYLTYALIDSCIGDYHRASMNKIKADNIADAEFLEKSKKEYDIAERIPIIEALENQNRIMSTNALIYVLIIVVLISFIIIAAFRFIKAYKKVNNERNSLLYAKEQLAILNDKLANEKQVLIQSLVKNNGLQDIIEIQSRCVNEIFKSVVYSGKRGASILKEFFGNNQYSIKLSSNFWDNLNTYINLTYPNAIQNIEKSGINLTEKEKTIIALDCLHIPNAVIGVILGYRERSLAPTKSKLISKISNDEIDIEKIMISYSKKQF